MEKDVTEHKLKIALEIICQLYRNKFITDAYIVGSIAAGMAKKESDIDISIINPLFGEMIRLYELQFANNDKRVSEFHPIVRQIIAFLENIGVGSTFAERIKTGEIDPELDIYQTFKGELTQIWEYRNLKSIHKNW